MVFFALILVQWRVERLWGSLSLEKYTKCAIQASRVEMVSLLQYVPPRHIHAHLQRDNLSQITKVFATRANAEIESERESIEALYMCARLKIERDMRRVYLTHMRETLHEGTYETGHIYI